MFRAVLTAVLTTALAAGALLVLPSTPTAVAADDTASTFTPRSPLRVLDTRSAGGPVGAGRTVTIDLAARVPATATAVVLNVTGVAPTASTFVTAYPGGTARPTASSLNLEPGEVRANQVTVALGATRTVTLYNNSGSTHLVADLAGHYGTEAGSKFTVLAQSRVLDTRGDSPLTPGGTRTLELRDAVPASATAVTFNLTATAPTASTFVTAWPAGTTRPTASNLNVVAQETRPNQVTVELGATKQVSLYNNSGTVHLLADLTGFYTPEYGAGFLPLSPTRVLDTRTGLGTGGPAAPVGQGETIRLELSHTVPIDTTGVAMNLTGANSTASTYVTAWGQWMVQPHGTSTLNLVPGKAIPNAATIPFTRYRGVELYNHRGSTHLVGDLAGVFVVSTSDCAPGCARAWGSNDSRKLGTGQTVDTSATPTPVANLTGVRQVVSGGWSGTSYAVLTDGTVRAWGDNGVGQLGNGWSGNATGVGIGSAVPVPVVNLTGVSSVASRSFSAYAMKSDGTVWGWGSGILGNGTTDWSNVPVRVSNLTGVRSIAAGGQATYALKSDGTVWAWGYNSSGELGLGDTQESAYTPVRIPSLADVVSVAAGSGTAYAVKSDGTLWAWGQNQTGQLGTGQVCEPGERCESRVPVQVPGLTDVRSAAGATDNAYALRADGTVLAWGSRIRGRTGDGVVCDDYLTCVSHTPVPVTGLTDVTAIASFDGGGYALREDGTVRAWGDNMQKALGNESVFDYATSPVQVSGLTGVTALGSGYHAGFAVTS